MLASATEISVHSEVVVSIDSVARTGYEEHGMVVSLAESDVLSSQF